MLRNWGTSLVASGRWDLHSRRQRTGPPEGTKPPLGTKDMVTNLIKGSESRGRHL